MNPLQLNAIKYFPRKKIGVVVDVHFGKNANLGENLIPQLSKPQMQTSTNIEKRIFFLYFFFSPFS